MNCVICQQPTRVIDPNPAQYKYICDNPDYKISHTISYIFNGIPNTFGLSFFTTDLVDGLQLNVINVKITNIDGTTYPHYFCGMGYKEFVPEEIGIHFTIQQWADFYQNQILLK